jgi:hypothetical protein
VSPAASTLPWIDRPGNALDLKIKSSDTDLVSTKQVFSVQGTVTTPKSVSISSPVTQFEVTIKQQSCLDQSDATTINLPEFERTGQAKATIADA